VDRGELRARLLRTAESVGLRLVRFLYCDNDGIIRGKASGISHIAERLESGIGLTVAMQAFSLLDRLAPVEGMGPVGEIRLVPDLETFVVTPYAPATGAVLVDMLTLDRRPYAADGRHFLRRMIERAAGRGLEMVAAFEPEWTLVAARDGHWDPFDRSLCFSSQGMQAAAEVVDDIVAALEAQGLPVEQYYAELGWGQHELSIRRASALRAADGHILYRETVRGVAGKHGLGVSFAPKPWPDQPGNGCHLHFSAFDRSDGTNCFAGDGGPYAVSQMGRSFLAGVLDHLPGLLALTCASVNSYRRLQPQAWASAYRVWGPDNREAALRVPSRSWDRDRDSANIELKACDSTSNPYMALGGVIAAGLDGVERGLEPPPPVTVDPHVLSDADRAAVGAALHPRSLAEAVACLRRDQVLMDALGDRLATAYIAVKESDIEAFGAEDESFEYSTHRFRY